MIKVFSIILFTLCLYSSNYSQQRTFGHKILGNGDIISDIFLIQDGFVLDSITTYYFNEVEYSFEYNNDGKLKRDFNFISFPVLYKGRPRMVPGYRDYFYNERGEVDSIDYWYRNDSLVIHDSGVRIDYAYDLEGKIISKTYSIGDSVTKIEKNSYDSASNLVLNMIINTASSDTTYNIWEYDTQNRLILSKSITNLPYFFQYVYQYDSSGSVNCIIQDVQPDEINNYKQFYLEFDNSGKVINEKVYTVYLPDSTWRDTTEILYDYDEYGRILEMGPTTWFSYNADGNLDSLVCTHFSGGYLDFKTTFIDQYGNSITLPYWGVYSLHYSYSKLVTGLKKGILNGLHFTLSQNYPNPFNPTTKIQFNLLHGSKISLTIFDIQGRKVKELIYGYKSRGNYEITFDGTDLASGVYFYRLIAGEFVQTMRMILIK